MKIYTIIVTYNGSTWINKCLHSVINSTVKSKIIVVDNNSNDGTVNIIKKKFQQIQLIELKENIGFGRANNIGIEIAYKNNANYFFLLNQDAWVEPDTIKSLMEISKRNPDFGILSPVHFAGNKNYIDYLFINYLANQTDRRLLSELIVKREFSKEIYETKFVNAAVWLMTKKCINTVGGFDPIFHVYGEDNDYINRVLFHGLKIGICPEVFAYHDRIQKTATEPHPVRAKSIDLIKIKTGDYKIRKMVLALGYVGLAFLITGNKVHKFRFNSLLKILANHKLIKKHKNISKLPGTSFLNVDSNNE